MKTLILHPTDTCQWYALVNEAQAVTAITLNESTESYLVYLLMRFSHNPEFLHSVIALDFLESLHRTGSHKVELLKTVGDKSLLFSGLFPGIAARRKLDSSYFLEMGQTAYLNAGGTRSHPLADVFLELSAEFPNLQKILQAMRSEDKVSALR